MLACLQALGERRASEQAAWPAHGTQGTHLHLEKPASESSVICCEQAWLSHHHPNHIQLAAAPQDLLQLQQPPGHLSHLLRDMSAAAMLMIVCTLALAFTVIHTSSCWLRPPKDLLQLQQPLGHLSHRWHSLA